MSDLLAPSLKALTDELASSIEALKEENRNLRRELDVAHTVQILRCKDGVDGEDDEVIVYASGKFQDGNYGLDEKTWEIALHTHSNNNDNCLEQQLEFVFGTTISDSINTKILCGVSDLKHCDVCIGGGFPLISFNTEHTFQDSTFGEIDPNDGNDDSKAIQIYFNPLDSCIGILIHGVPNDEWRLIFQEMEDNRCKLHEIDLVMFLDMYVGDRCPDATIEFTAVAFSTQKIHAGIKRLLSSAQKAEARAERDARPENINSKNKNNGMKEKLQPHQALGIIFDLDGTLADSWKLGYEATNVVLQQNTISPISAEMYHSHTQYATLERFARHAELSPTSPNFHAIGHQLGQEFDDLYVDLVSTETAGYYDGIQDLLNSLTHRKRRRRNGTDNRYRTVQIGVLTNACVAYAYAVLNLNEESNDYCVSNFTIHGADSVPQPKPSPEGLLQCCREMNFIPDTECVYIGDSPSDAVAAQACGMTSIGVLWGSHSYESMIQNHAPFDYYVRTVEELQLLLLGRPISNDVESEKGQWRIIE